MGRGNIQVSQRRCYQCGKPTKAERNALEWGAGDLLMIFLTLLCWLPFKLGWNALVNPWRCSECGARAA